MFRSRHFKVTVSRRLVAPCAHARRCSLFAVALLTLAFVVLPSLAAASVEEAPAPSALQSVLEVYERIRLGLVADDLAPIASAARQLSELLADLEVGPSAALGVEEEQQDEVARALAEMRRAAQALTAADDLAATRDAFYALSKPLVRWLHHVEGQELAQVAYCPMKKRSWVQPHGEIGNPYGGQAMPTCGNTVSR